MNDLKNKNIIVTGATGGIGNSIIKKLDEFGVNILASGTRIEKLEELKEKILLRKLSLERESVDAANEWVLIVAVGVK